MNKTIFDVEDIRKVRYDLSKEYAAMTKNMAKTLQNERVEEEMQKIAQLRFLIKSVDICPNDLKTMEALHFF